MQPALLSERTVTRWFQGPHPSPAGQRERALAARLGPTVGAPERLELEDIVGGHILDEQHRVLLLVGTLLCRHGHEALWQQIYQTVKEGPSVEMFERLGPRGIVGLCEEQFGQVQVRQSQLGSKADFAGRVQRLQVVAARRDAVTHQCRGVSQVACEAPAHRHGVAVQVGHARESFSQHAARERGMHTHDPASIIQNCVGAHVRVRTTGSADAAKQLLLEYGAYSAPIIN
jgi:hypothetical protein